MRPLETIRALARGANRMWDAFTFGSLIQYGYMPREPGDAGYELMRRVMGLDQAQ